MTKRLAAPMPLHSGDRQITSPTGVRTAGRALGTVWPTGQADLSTQFRARLPTRYRQRRLAPDAARGRRARHRDPHPTRSDLVLDPDCGAGTTLVEALHGRSTHHRPDRQPPLVALGACQRQRRQGRRSTGRWHGPRVGPPSHHARHRPPGRIHRPRRPRPDHPAPGHLAHPGRPSWPTPSIGCGSCSVDSRTLVRPGGHVVVTVAPYRHPDRPGEVLDLPSEVLSAGTAAGLVPLARCIALTAALHGRRLRPWTTRTQRQSAARMQRSTGRPVALPAHHTALVFGVAPLAEDAALSLPIPPLPSHSRRRCGRPAAA